MVNTHSINGMAHFSIPQLSIPTTFLIGLFGILSLTPTYIKHSFPRSLAFALVLGPAPFSAATAPVALALGRRKAPHLASELIKLDLRDVGPGHDDLA